MGGHAAGNVASNLATSTFNKTFSGLYPATDVPAALKASLLSANDAIQSAITETPALKGMGCTMVVAFLASSKLWWVSVGDSHLYLLRDRALTKLNADHSYGGFLKRMQDQGILVEPDPNLSPNMLMSALIGEEIAEIDLPEKAFQLLPGDRVMVATDGLDTLSQGALIQYAAWNPAARDCVGAFLQAVDAAKQPRQDNTTVVVIDIKKRAQEPLPPPAKEPKRRTDFEATQPLLPEDRKAAMAVAPAAQPALEPREPVVEEEPPRPERRRWLVGAAIVVLLAIAAGAAYVWLERRPPPEVPAVATAVPAPPPAQTPAPAETQPVEAQPAAQPQPAAGGRTFEDPLKIGGEGPQMVEIPGGTFEMGDRPSALTPDEHPRHKVTVRPFAMSRFEVTFAEYDRFARATGRPLPPSGDLDRDTHPVVGVSWEDAYQYTRWLSAQTGKQYRLPSEAEWEYAARAGTQTDFWWGKDVGRGNAHCFDCKSDFHPRQPARVGMFRPSPFGLFDTAGNVAEWVHDCYHPNYSGAPEDGSVWEGGDCSRRVMRGGSFNSVSGSLRPARRDKLPATGGHDHVGIRVAREL
jgi:formylglycine-generating enzyme required for sulfatase activity